VTEAQTPTPSVFKGIKKKVKTFVVIAILLIALPQLLYVVFRSNTFQTFAIRYLMEQVGQSFGTKISIGGIDISFFDHVTLEKILVEDQSRDTLIYIDQLKVQIDSIRPADYRIHLSSIIVQQPRIHLFQDTAGTNFQFVLDSIHASPPKQDKSPWIITFNNLFVRDAEFRFKKPFADTIIHEGINLNDLSVNKLNFSLVHVKTRSYATSMVLDNASFSEKSGFSLKNMTFNATLDSTGLQIQKFALISPHSNIFSDSMKVTHRKSFQLDNATATRELKDLPFAFQYGYEGNLAESIVSLSDLAFFMPEIWGMNESVLISGGVKGTIDNLKFKKLNFRIGEKTSFNADLELKGLPDWQNTYIFLKFYNNTFNFNDFSLVRLPDKATMRYPKIPVTMLDDVDLTYQGTFSGFPSDFVAYGNLNGDLGSLSTDIAIAPSFSGSLLLRGMLDAKSFKAGKFFGFEPLGEVTLHTEVRLNKKMNNFDALLKGNIDSLYYNGNRIDSIYLNGKASNKSYDGQLTINDDKLRLKFSGIANLEQTIPTFNFTASVNKANLFVLGIDKLHKDATTSFDLEADFSGKNIDELNGSIDLQRMKIAREGKVFDVKKLNLSTTNSIDRNTITLRSDIADFDIIGKYRFLEFGLTLRDYLQYYLPSAKLPFSKEGIAGNNIFNFDINVKKPELITYFFLPELVPNSPIVMKGEINSVNKSLNFDCQAEDLSYLSYHTKGFSFSSRNVGKGWMLRLGMSEAFLGKNYSLENISLDNTLFNDTLLTTFAWGTASKHNFSGKINIEGIFSKSPQGLRMADFSVKPSEFLVSDTLWQFDNSTIHIDSTLLAINNFKLQHGSEFFRIDGQLTDNPADKLRIEANKINLGFLDLISKQKIGIEGTLSGTTEIADIGNSFFLNSNLAIRNFHYYKNYFGDVILSNRLNKEENRVYTSISLNKRDTTSLLINGYYNLNADSLNYLARLTDFPVETIYPFLRSFSNGVSGIGNGSVAITGSLKDPCFIGKVDIKDGKIGVDYTKTAYTFSQPVEFADDSIVFRRISLKDSKNNSAMLNGYITHKMFNHLKYNLGVTTRKLEALHTHMSDNSLFYGDASCSGDILITGAGEQVKIDLNVRTEDGTQIFIPMETPASAAENNFIRFVSKDNEKKNIAETRKPPENSSLEMNMNITATPNAKIQILFNSTLGDVISGQGSGTLRMVYDKLGNFTMFGNYTIDKGDYLFTLQNVIGKKFKLEEGGTITWNGDPYGAIVDLNAIYSLKASVKDLLADTYKNEGVGRIPVDCKINLSRKLLNPNLKFDILFPSADERTKDELQQFISTQDDINRQMLALLLLGQFYTPEYIRGRTNSQGYTGDLVGATTSEMLSNQLSNWLSQISSNFDVGFNYKPGDQVNTNQMELALSTQIFDDRVTINGNIGNNSNLQSTNNSAVLGEIEVFVKLIKSGKLQLKVYNRANTDMTYDTSPYKQGIGFSYRESFNSLKELFHPQKEKKQPRFRTTDSIPSN